MKLKLNLHERLIFLDLLPKQESFATLKILRKVQEDLSLSEKEWKEYDVKKSDKPGVIEFDPVKAQKEKEYDIGEVAVHLVKDKLSELDKDKKLSQEHFPIYEKLFN